MSRCPGKHAKTAASRYEGRHSKPGGPGPAAIIGTAAKAVPVSLVAGAAGSALVLSGTASAATVGTGSPLGTGTKDLASLKPTAITAAFTKGRHHRPHHPDYTVAPGDTLSHISARFCGTPADYPSLAAASGISNPNVIQRGEKIKLDCHHAVPRPAPAPAHASPPSSASSGPSQQAPAQETSAGGPAGMSAFESCVISRESGGNPQAYNPASGAGGLFQFLPSTWAALGYAGAYPGGAQTAPASVQEAAFAKLYAEAGTSPWAPYDGC
jgi:resuscitation-promoting factor RpfC